MRQIAGDLRYSYDITTMIAEETGANILQEVETTAISTERCESLWSPFGVNIDDSRICF